MASRGKPSARSRAGWALATPAAVLLLALVFVPSAAVLLLAFTDYEFGLGAIHFVGLGNFRILLTEPRFRQSLANTLGYVAVVTPVSVGLALWLAVLLQRSGVLGRVWRAILFLPVTSTLVAMATAWGVLLHPTFGFVNVVAAALGLGKTRFLSDPATALLALAFIGIWKQVGFNVLLFVAGLATVPQDLYEAAAVDGADRGWSRFQMVTWPMLAPVTMFVAVITLIRAFSEFDTVAVLTQGGPTGSTTVVMYTLYEEAFRFFRVGVASAVAVVFLLAVGTVAVAKARVLDRRVRHA